ncbi:hypothetical protein MTO96_049430 [Rhipicephalus appendiculatus]
MHARACAPFYVGHEHQILCFCTTWLLNAAASSPAVGVATSGSLRLRFKGRVWLVRGPPVLVAGLGQTARSRAGTHAGPAGCQNGAQCAERTVASDGAVSPIEQAARRFDETADAAGLAPARSTPRAARLPSVSTTPIALVPRRSFLNAL